MSTVVEIWSDLHCPWATTVVTRLRAARDELGVDVVFDQRAWPLEWVNEQGTPRGIVQPETAVLANHEPGVFSVYRGESWPSTFLPAFELVAAARRVGGLRAAEEVDAAVRLRFFRHGEDVSLRHVLRRAAADAAAHPSVDADAVLHAWESEPVRADVVADFERSRDLPIKGSPQVFWPDGTTTHNPGLDDHEWVRGIPVIHSDDRDACARLLRDTLP